MQLYGGSAAIEMVRSQRNHTTNLTILGDDDLTDVNGVVTTTDNISGTNSYHVVWADGVTHLIAESTVLDGFNITAGQANDSGWPDDSGGGFYCDGEGNGSECSPTLRNFIVWDNTAVMGTQLYNFTATPSISYSLIQSDTNTIFNSIGSSIIYGPNALTNAPHFVDDDGADNLAGTLDDDLRLFKNSPAIDS